MIVLIRDKMEVHFLIDMYFMLIKKLLARTLVKSLDINDVTKSASRSNQSTPTQSGGLWECSVCGRGFNRNWHLKRHLATHLAVKPYSCPYCPHASNIKANLSLHIRKMHQDKRVLTSLSSPFSW
ncbi:Transcription factor steA [Armadillidium nasatum]|uniref:Transcription factor steA n=1 Tax=Armadillidium nasatum TaxID=96803 RepID=A0A5N5SJ17_9CRUS|nr:Transcription factor steA [Armadillidium nasatum]